jgi:hypothetical protein
VSRRFIIALTTSIILTLLKRNTPTSKAFVSRRLPSTRFAPILGGIRVRLFIVSLFHYSVFSAESQFGNVVVSSNFCF